MKKKIFGGMIVLAIAAVAAFNVNFNLQNNQFASLTLANVEALAEESGGEKKYRYDTVFNDECYVYVGGAYAKGKKVTCWPGSDHPVCVECVL